jgi:hypothetical protein
VVVEESGCETAAIVRYFRCTPPHRKTRVAPNRRDVHDPAPGLVLQPPLMMNREEARDNVGAGSVFERIDPETELAPAR